MNNSIMIKSLATTCLVFSMAVNSFGQKSNGEQLSQLNTKLNPTQISFTENKGQVIDQNKLLRSDVLFGGENNGLVFHLRKNGISYQLNRIDKWKAEKENASGGKQNKHKGIESSTVYRVDINWLNANKKPAIVKNKELAGFENFCTSDKQLIVKSYAEVVYSNLYRGINLKWYEKNGELKYDYLCAAGSDYKKIELQIEGAQRLSINNKGELEITTPLGTIIEKSPIVLQSGKQLASKWVLDKNVLSFSIDNLNKDLPYVIDPAVRAWGTFYGGNSFDYANACATYTNGDVYMAGATYLNTSTIIATSGSHQTTLGGMDDAFLVKFNSSGARQWSTYYGGSDSDNGRSLVVDASGNVYMCGITSSTNGIATVGSHQSAIGGGNLPDGFLVKFNSAGVRQWATYYGGNSSDEFHHCALDPNGNIYVSGTTDLATNTVIATVGTHQSAFGGGLTDAFLVKFNTNGVRQWGTYYGGTGIDFGYGCTADANNVYLAGTTTSSIAAMVSAGCHQSTYGGSLYDGYLVKFNASNGTRDWATFYGGNAIDFGYHCATDGSGNVYLCGTSNSSVTNVIATAAAHQTAGATFGDDDAYLVKFSSTGTRLWATYYGGDDYDQGYDCKTDASNNVYLVGATNATLSSVIATAGSHQTLLGNSTNGTNAFLTKFNASGVRQWGTYYGEDGEVGNSCALDASGAIYVCGPAAAVTSSYVSTPGSHQPNPGGISDGYLVKFTDCNAPAPINVTPAGNQTLCAGSTATLSATSGTSTITWYTTATSTQVIATGTTYITSALSTGTYTFYAEGGGCVSNNPRTGITVTVSPTPTITVAANTGTICAGQSFTVQPNGASTYTVFNASVNPLPGTVLSPSITSNYFVAGTSANGCISTFLNMQTLTITVNASPTITVNSGAICVGQSFVIQPSGANSYTIQGGTATVSPNTSTTYTISGTGANGCIAATPAICQLTVDATPTVVVSNASVCPNTVYTIQPGGASTYTIQGGSFTISPNSNTSYTIIGASPAGCLSQNIATCNVVMLQSPTITASNGTICSGQSFTITPSGAATYSLVDFNVNPYTSNMVVSPVSNTLYVIAGTGLNGCVSGTANIAVIGINVKSASITVNSGTICGGSSFTIVPSGGVSYTIEGGNYVVNPSTTSGYTIMGTDNQGCTGSATSTVTVASPPNVSVNNGSICAGSSFTIIPVGFATYTISGGTAVVSPSTETNYTIVGTTSGLCPLTKTLQCTVEVNALPRMPFPSTLTPTDFISTGRGKIIDGPSYGSELQFVLTPSTSTLAVFNNGTPYLELKATPNAPQVYSITLNNATCPATYTFLLEAEKVYSDDADWVFPTFVSPNGDEKNDNWMLSFRGYTAAFEFFYFFGNSTDYVRQGYETIKLGKSALKSVKIIYNGEIIYEQSSPFKFLPAWSPQDNLKDRTNKTYALFSIEFKNGVKKIGWITIDPTSKD